MSSINWRRSRSEGTSCGNWKRLQSGVRLHLQATHPQPPMSCGFRPLVWTSITRISAPCEEGTHSTELCNVISEWWCCRWGAAGPQCTGASPSAYDVKIGKQKGPGRINGLLCIYKIHRKRHYQQLYCCLCIRCCVVFTEALPSNDMRIHIQTDRGIYEVRCWDRVRWHDIHTEFCKHWYRHSKVGRVRGIHRHTDGMYIG
jgi:hypothetical protein